MCVVCVVVVVVVGRGEGLTAAIVFPSAALQNYKNNREPRGARGKETGEHKAWPAKKRTYRVDTHRYRYTHTTQNVSTTVGCKVCWVWKETHLTACPHPSYTYMYIDISSSAYSTAHIGGLYVHMYIYKSAMSAAYNLTDETTVMMGNTKYEATNESHRITFYYMHQYSGKSGMFFSFSILFIFFFAQISHFWLFA